jgi:hypothetical protein
MPLCFWATQTAVAALDLFVGTGRSKFTPCLPPHSAATVIQLAYCSYISVKYPMRALLAHINASMARFKACVNADKAKFDARIAHFNADLGRHVGCSGQPIS